MDFFKGASAEQDSRFGNKDKKLMKQMSFPDSYNTKVDMKKVNMDVMRPWIAKKIVELLGFEDEIVIEFVFSLLETESDPRAIQIKLTGFLESKTAPFVSELWDLLVSAQSTIGGIPQKFLDEKKAELRKKRVKQAIARSEEEQRIAAEIQERKRKERETAPEERKSSRHDRRRDDDRVDRSYHRSSDDRDYHRRRRSHSRERRSHRDRSSERRRRRSRSRSPHRSLHSRRNDRRYNSRSRSPSPSPPPSSPEAR